MKTERTARECVEIFLTALRQGKALGRLDIVDTGLLTAREADRALKALRAAGAIRRSAPSEGAEPRAVRYEPTETAKVRPRRRPNAKSSQPAKVCFDSLLAAWGIRIPSTRPSGRYVGVVNDAFAREEQREMATLRKANRSDGEKVAANQ